MSQAAGLLTRTTTIGPLLQYALARLTKSRGSVEMYEAAAHMGATAVDTKEVLLPIVLKLERQKPDPREPWAHYKERIHNHLTPIGKMVKEIMGMDPMYLFAANAIKVWGTPEQIYELGKQERIQRMELNPLLQVVSMDDTVKNIDLADFRQRHPKYDGAGVTVAVLDSGIDFRHPFLQVHDSVSTCGEPIDLPGSHGTHCAGIIASKDSFYPGIAPGVTLLNIKVLQADGRGEPANIPLGIDAALDRGADVLSMSMAFNHLPPWSQSGHGWECKTGHCLLCTAIDNAVSLDNKIAVVAAGNDHERAASLRNYGHGGEFDTEIGCPGQAREAITVGAVTKQPYLPASFSSCGPTAFGTVKPEICAPGVNITSTTSLPPNYGINSKEAPNRAILFCRKSGTSMATPVVAGVVALIIQKFKENGTEITSNNVKKELYLQGMSTLPGQGKLEVCKGVISLKNI